METKTKVLEVISFCKQHNFYAELVGKWVWVSFDEKPDKATLKTLKDMGFKWSRRRGKWANNCGHPTKSAYQSDPWETYHHRTVSGTDERRLS